jgi:hypothetical protein
MSSLYRKLIARPSYLKEGIEMVEIVNNQGREWNSRGGEREIVT